MIVNNSYRTSDGWLNQYLEALKHAVNEHEHRLLELEDYIKYVDATAPELRTAYKVSKRIE